METQTKRRTPWAAIVAVTVLLLSCILLGWYFLGRGGTSQNTGEQTITLIRPRAAATVGNPFEVSGNTSRPAEQDTLRYRVFATDGNVIGEGTVPVPSTNATSPYTFTGSISFAPLPVGENITLEMYDQSTNDDEVHAQSRVALVVGTTTVIPENPQSITIETPPPGTIVGSPVVITGRTARYPFEGNLSYRVLDASNTEIGSGSFPVDGTIDQPATFNASLTFNPPPDGGSILVVVYERDQSSGTVIAQVSIGLNVASPQPQQTILITSPPPGTQVGSPVVLTGGTSQFPTDGNLNYRVIDRNGTELGTGRFPVQGIPGQPSTFNASLTFNEPSGGGHITVTIFEQDPATGNITAQVGIGLNVVPPQPTPIPEPTAQPEQTITITSPAPGTQVGSPVVVTGRTNLFPAGGTLNYRFLDAVGNGIGSGSFPVEGGSNQSTNFTASLNFTEPASGGPITGVIYEQNQATGTIIAQASIALNVAAPPPQPQEITIESPAPGTQVGSPVVVTGRTTRFPFEGNLNYRVVDAINTELGSGNIQVQGSPGQPTSFNASLNFTEPAGGGPITITVYEQDQSNGGIIAQASVALNVAAPPLPPTPVSQEITIETPAPDTTVGSPMVVTGRTTRFPFEGNLSYRILDAARNELGKGGFIVDGDIGQPATFRAELTFDLPPNGGRIFVTIYEQDQASGDMLAEDSIALIVAAPQPQPR